MFAGLLLFIGLLLILLILFAGLLLFIGLLLILLILFAGLLLLLVLLILLVFLLLLIVGLLGLLTRLLHELLELFDLFFEFLGLLAVGQKKLLIANDGRVAGMRPHALAVEVFRTVQHGQRLADAFLRAIEVLRLKFLHGVLKPGPGVEVGDHADVLVGGSAHQGILLGSGDGAFVERPGFLVVMLHLLLIEPEVVEFGGRPERFGFRRFGLLARIRDRRGLPLDGDRLDGLSGLLSTEFGLESEAEQRRDREQSLHGAGTRLRDAEEEREEEEGGRERIGGAFDWAEHGDGVLALLPVEHFDAGFEFVDAAERRGGTDVHAAGPARKFGQLGLVQGAFHRVALAVGEDAELAAFVLHADDGGIGGVAHADCEDGYLRLREVADDRCAAPGELVAVGHEDHGFVHALRALERLYGFLERELDIGAADRDRVRVEVVDELDETGAVDREGTDQERLARERDEAEAVARILLHDFAHEPFRVVHAARLHVVGEHALRNVEQHQQVAPGGGVLHDLFAPGGTRRGHDREQDDPGEQEQAEDAFAP